MKILILSPHYDDAIYSCGGTLYQLAQDGHEIHIWTLMATIPQAPLPDTPVLKDNHQRWQTGENPVAVRRQEDQLAASIIGATTQYADILDCIYRVSDSGMALYPSEDSLWKNIHPDDPAITQLEKLQLPAADMILAPLGVGQHVDHLIVRNWGLQLAQTTQITVQFYVEYPYLRSRSAVDAAYSAFSVPLQRNRSRFPEQAMQHKIRAMAAYKSQITSFWDNEAAIDAEVRRTFTVNQEFVEEFAQPM